MHTFKSLVLVFILLFSFCLEGFCQYAGLVGKWVKINGPEYLMSLMVTLDEATCDSLNDILARDDSEDYNMLFESNSVIRIKNRISAIVLDVKVLENKAKVVILTGLHKGISGWIPVKWLDGNKERPRFSRS